jgi:Skp family chaperone for outer membrane proteins
MKNLALILSILSFVGVITIFVMSHTDHVKPATQAASVSSDDTTAVEEIVPSNMAYIDVQRITNEYAYYKEILADLEIKQKRAEAEFNKKAQVFQKEYEAFVKKAQMGAFISAESQQQQEMDLRRQQENLGVLEQDLSMKLQNDMQKLDAQATDTIMKYLKYFNSEAKYDIILNKVTILDPGAAVDVTDTIVSLLNHRYHLQKNPVE